MTRALLPLALAAAIVLGAGSALAADSLPIFTVHVTGVVQRTVGVTPNDLSKARIQSQTISNGSLFSEFNVSPDDYVLVISLQDSALEFLPLRASSTKATVKVFLLGAHDAEALDAGAQTAPFQQEIISSPDAANTLFENCEGRFVGTLRLQPPLKDPATQVIAGLKGAVYVVGHDPSTVAPVPPVELHLTTGKAFVQLP